jgi:hypothetical protein
LRLKELLHCTANFSFLSHILTANQHSNAFLAKLTMNLLLRKRNTVDSDDVRRVGSARALRGAFQGRIPLLALATLFVLMLAGCGYSYVGYDEPGIRGKIVDAETKQPIAGAIVYGYYATVEGNLGGGERVKEVLRSFEVVSDANGSFEIAPWRLEKRLAKGVARNQFPVMGIYKGGYQAYGKRLESLRYWGPASHLPTTPMTPVNNIFDHSARPHELKKAANEKARYSALIDAGDALAYADSDAPCGWEKHTALLLEMHNEWKEFLKRNIPPDGLDARGYKKSSYSHPNRDWMLSNKSALDRLI